MPHDLSLYALRRVRVAAASLVALLVLQSSAGIGLAAPVHADLPVASRAPDTSSNVGLRLDDALDRRLRRAVGGSDVPGMSMAIVTRDGRIWEGAAGVDRHGERLTPAMPQTIASITKTFTAAIAMQLVEEGRLELDVPATRYLPGVKLLTQVRVRQLLNHTSGIADLYGAVKGRLQGAPQRPLATGDVLGRIGSNWFQPSKGYGYSNTNFYLLGLIIERVTGRSFADELADRITGPLGFEATRLLGDDDRQLPPAWSTAFWTSGAMISTPAELARFGQALYGGDLVSAKSREGMTRFAGGRPYGLGTQRLALGSRIVPGHSGLLYATTSLLVHLPGEGVTVAIFGTAPHADLAGALTKPYAGRSMIDIALELVASG